MKTPIILLAFANNLGERHLESLADEQNGIQYALMDLHVNHRIAYLDKSQFKSKDLFKIINEYRERIIAFHFAGHAGSRFGSETDGPDSPMIVLNNQDQGGKTLVFDYFKNCPNLKLIFLNGCATYGFVNLIREANIEAAIIATKVKINDEQASGFAVQFYEALAKENTTLEEAFRLASGNLKPLLTPQIQRGITAATNDEEEEMPWTLFVDGAVRENWQIAKPADIQRVVSEEIINYQKEVAALQTRTAKIRESLQHEKKKNESLSAKRSELEQMRIYLNSTTDDALKSFFSKRISEIEQEISNSESGSAEGGLAKDLAKVREQIQGYLQKIIEKTKEKLNEGLKDELRSKIKDINYSEQLKEFRTLWSQFNEYLRSAPTAESSSLFPGQAFIIFGTKFCGHEILLEKLLKRATGNTYKIIIELSDNSKTQDSISSADDLWKRILEMLDSGRYEESKKIPEAVLGEIAKKNESGNDVVFIFRISSSIQNKRRELIIEYWNTLLKLAKSSQFEFNPRNKILLFVLDKSRPNPRADCLQDKQKYSQELVRIGFEKPFGQLITPISPIDKETLESWIDSIDFNVEEFSGKLSELAAEDLNLPVFCTIDAVCEKLGESELFLDILEGLDPKIPLKESDQIRRKSFDQTDQSNIQNYPEL
jgi:hypothetical protein